jgi:GxxExxY protein
MLNGGEVTGRIIGAALHVHSQLGPGLLESAYEGCLAWELNRIGLRVERQKALPVTFNGHRIDIGYRLDLLVGGEVIVEVKAIERFDPIHTAQLVTYLRFSGCHVGLLLNFNVAVLRDGIKRVVLSGG